jgi:hypothetical protein
MTAAQLVTPTTSQLATVNAIQAAVTASTNWTVNATGTSSIGAKYVEIRPSNTSSLYKDYRILVVERVNNGTNKSFPTGDGGSVNSTGFVYFLFVPDGGAAHVTFTVANLETSSDVYVGSRYKNGTSTVWHTAPMPCTAVWLYLCDGAFWLIDRVTGSSHTLLGLGHINVWTGFTDYNTAGTEVGVPAFRKQAAITSQSAQSWLTAAHSTGLWYGSGTSPRTYQNGYAAGIFRLFTTDNSSSVNALLSRNTTANTMSFVPVGLNYYVTAVGPIQASTFLRGVYLGLGQKTRTTIQSSGVTVGYTWYPDDAASGVQLATLAFLNS